MSPSLGSNFKGLHLPPTISGCRSALHYVKLFFYFSSFHQASDTLADPNTNVVPEGALTGPVNGKRLHAWSLDWSFGV